MSHGTSLSLTIVSKNHFTGSLSLSLNLSFAIRIMHCNENDPLVTVFLSFIFLFFMCLTIYYLYVHWCLPRSRSHHIRSSNHRPTMVFFAATDPSHTASRGLDPAVVKSLPVFTFSGATQKDPIDCAVCLSEFEDGEPGRVLPGCKHAFHVECIDMWFHSHSTCPLCRSLVEPHATTVEEEQVTIMIAISPEQVSATEPVSSSGSGSSAETETPRRIFSEFEDGLTRNSPVNHSPMSRMLSFTRMVSRNRRSAPSSFSGAPSQSPSSSCQVVMNESDIERGGEEIKSDFRHVGVP
ncbi:RING-H2 finger protein ATL2-like [Brassica napus]|nr:RING-H2 finger protein ATL2-like [Brassica napus]